MKLILITHGEVGKELVKSCEMILGAINGVYTISLNPDKSMEQLISETEDLIKSLTAPILIATDLYGGTPNNVAMYCAAKHRIEVITGLNLALLISLVLERDNNNLEEIISKSLVNAKGSIKRCHLVGEGKENE